MYQYPYGNAQQLNLDWLMEQWQTVKQSIDGSLQGEIDRVEAAITDLLAARDAAVAAAGAANTSAGAAAQSAQAAAAAAATATAQAAAATQERVNAAQAANNAQQYAGNAQTQAAAAQNAAGQAAVSASQAAADASDAHDDAVAASGSAVNAAASAAGALQNFQLSDAARQAAQAAEQDAEAAATLLQPPATSADIGKALIVKTVGGGTVTAYELGESGGGGGTPLFINTIENVPIATFNDGTNTPIKKIEVEIQPVQASGTPTPENPIPITGWTSANINVSDADTSTPDIYAITFPAEAGTVYGGTLTINEDGSGVLVKKYNMVNGSAFTWYLDNSYSYPYFYSSNSRTMLNTLNKKTLICDRYNGIPNTTGVTFRTTNHNLECMANASSGSTNTAIYIQDSNYNSVEDFSAAIADAVFVFELKESSYTTYNLTAQQVITLLQGTNNVWSNTGNIIQLQYYTDSKGYIDEQDTLVKALIAPVLDDMIADTALTANDFRIVVNTLYRITAPVAAGAALTPNTNCTATTIGTVLKTLLS